MNLEEAKLSVGKIVRVYVVNVTNTLHLGEHNYKLNYVNDIGLCSLSLESNDMACCKIHHNDIYPAGSRVKYKIGDEVVLRPETKPYTFTNCLGKSAEAIIGEFPEKKTFTVNEIHNDGDVFLCAIDNEVSGYINPRHLKHAKEDTNIGTLSVDLELNELLKDIDIVEIRLAIFNGNTSRTLEEMKEIEEWILGDK